MTADDPFDAFARNAGAGTVRDPYPAWAELRDGGPVHPLSPHTMLGLPPDVDLTDLPPMFVVVGHDEAAEVLKDAATFSSAHYSMVMGPVMGRTILEMDPPEHQRHRALAQQAFTKRALERWRDGLVAESVDHHLDPILERGAGDLVRELTFPFPVRVIAGLLGLPEEDLADFHRLSVELISFTFDPDGGLRASAALADYLGPIIDARRGGTGEDVITLLANAEVDGTRLDDDAILAFLRLLLPAGAETTYRSSSNLLYGLLGDRAQWEALVGDRDLLPRAVEEGLRWECPLTTIARAATRDVDLAGVPIPAGAIVTIGLGAANRDPSRWPDPDRFDIHRPPRPHLAFAAGPHTCLGLHLARLETTVLLERLLDRAPDLHLDGQDLHITGAAFRAPTALPARVTPAAA